MNITFFIGGLQQGGAERVICNLANYLVDKNHVVKIVTLHDGKTYELDTRVTHDCIDQNDTRQIKRKFHRYFALKKYLKTNKTDLYVAFLPIEICLMIHLKKNCNAPIIVSERNNPSSYSKLLQVVLRHYTRKADGAVFQTEEARKWYHLEGQQTRVIPNALNPEFIGEVHIQSRKKEIVAVGRLAPQKNFKLLINAFSRIAKKHPDYKLVIYGEGDQREELEAQIHSLHLNEQVCLPGFSKDVKGAIKDASMFVLSSDYEGMPNALLEAMALGISCISTDCPCGGPRSLIDSGKNGLLVSVKDEDNLAKAMELFIDDRQMADALGENARKIREKLSPEIVAKKWEDFFDSVINSTKTEHRRR